MDEYDDGKETPDKFDLTHSNLRKIPKRKLAAALETGKSENSIPEITAAGRGKIAEQILQLAFEQGIPVREDEALAQMLVKMELDSPIPSEAFLAVAEILSYVYRANDQENPFDAVLAQTILEQEEST